MKLIRNVSEGLEIDEPRPRTFDKCEYPSSPPGIEEAP
jgi:hypothetical protein